MNASGIRVAIGSKIGVVSGQPGKKTY